MLFYTSSISFYIYIIYFFNTFFVFLLNICKHENRFNSVAKFFDVWYDINNIISKQFKFVHSIPNEKEGLNRFKFVLFGSYYKINSTIIETFSAIWKVNFKIFLYLPRDG